MPSIGINAGIAMAGKALGVRVDPYKAYNFLVEIEGIIAGGFTDVSGLTVTTQVESVREGGVNDYIHKLPKWTEQSNLELKKGVTGMDMLWSWYADVIDGQIKRKNGSIYMLDHQGLPAMWWDFVDAYPIKWTGPIFNAASSSVAFESLTLTHHGLTKPLGSQALAAARAAAKLAGF